MDGQVNSIPLADGNPNLKAMFGDAIGNIKSEILDKFNNSGVADNFVDGKNKIKTVLQTIENILDYFFKTGDESLNYNNFISVATVT
jgi:hypothetical protein